MRFITLVGAILLVLVAFFQGEKSPATWFAIENISIQGQLKYTSIEELKESYSFLVGRSLFAVSVSDILEVAKKPEWIEKAEVRKVWPNTLQIFVHEHLPLAYWGKRQVLSSSAVILSPGVVPSLPLPRLYGPTGSSDVVLEQFGLIGQVLATTSLRVYSLTLEPRGAWNIVFVNGVKVKLGREDVLDRLQRFIAVYKSDLSGRIDQITSVDARYPHGVAVGWKEK